MTEPLHRNKDASWQPFAACAGTDPNLWFPERGESATLAYREARKVCAECPVRRQCLDYALTPPVETMGVWGGLSARERGQLRGRRVK